MTEELIVLVDESGKPIGTAPKLASHHANTPLHLAFSCYIFNQRGEFLLTQRALSKKVWPGVWTNSVCGHPAPNESMEDAIRRRLKDELGIETQATPKVVLPNYRYKSSPFEGIVENEICPVYAMRVDLEPNHNPEEVEAYEWADWTDLSKRIAEDPDTYSYWMKDQLPQLLEHPYIKKLALID